MKTTLLFTCAFVVALPALALAAVPYATLPGGTISVNNTVGQTLGPLDGQGWADINFCDTSIDFNYIGAVKIKGGITSMTGQVQSSWAGTWGTVGLYERAWIEGQYINDSGFAGGANSYKMGWTPNIGMTFWTPPGGTYETGGLCFQLEDINAGTHVAKVMTPSLPPAIDFEIYVDLKDFNLANPAAGFGKAYCDYLLDPTNPASQWYSEQNSGEPFPAEGIDVGQRHGTWDASDPMYYNNFNDCVLGIALVEDNQGYSASYTYSDITLEIAGRLPGDINLDGIVNDIDAVIIAANWGKTGVGWFQGDCGGGNEAWALDGVIDEADLAVVASHWLMTLADLNPAAASAVPEPNMLVLLALGSLMLFVLRAKH